MGNSGRGTSNCVRQRRHKERSPDEKSAGYAIQFPHDWEFLSDAKPTPEDIQSAEAATELGVLQAAALIPKSRPLLIRCNNRSVIKKLTIQRQAQEDEGWISSGDVMSPYRHAAALLRSRSAKTLLQFSDPDGDGAMEEAVDEAKDTTLQEGVSRVAQCPVAFDLPGARLDKMTQRSAYRTIREIKRKSVGARSDTTAGLDRIDTQFTP
ncbi:hypothetical protein EXIGLDRAFT_812261 [Exidia glandulosa HHB12029]|uniref:Uncharacterized protein n=1 Tax=Exidia glandulosa HHB12029 TaxID=1314781 RepID=A0A165ZEK1_EXIGL|nr:hypothetical protein EXIGLDRAFT_812261 [Exidia glandulosa HHB12029]